MFFKRHPNREDARYERLAASIQTPEQLEKTIASFPPLVQKRVRQKLTPLTEWQTNEQA